MKDFGQLSCELLCFMCASADAPPGPSPLVWAFRTAQRSAETQAGAHKQARASPLPPRTTTPADARGAPSALRRTVRTARARPTMESETQVPGVALRRLF